MRHIVVKQLRLGIQKLLLCFLFLKILKEFPIYIENDDKSKRVEVSLSAGVIFTKVEEKLEYDKLYRKVDSFMYKAKKNGKGHAVMELQDGREEIIFR